MAIKWTRIYRECLFFTAILFLYPTRSHACYCANVPAALAKQDATVVFHGRVLRVEHLLTINAADPETGKIRQWIPAIDDVTVVTIQVDMTWKGPVTSKMKFLSVIHPQCGDGYSFGVMGNYLVYASELPHIFTDIKNRFPKEHIYDIGFCPFPNLEGDMTKAIAILGKGKRIKED